MKIAPCFYSKSSLITKVNKRNIRRIKEYTFVSPEVKPAMADVINRNLDSVARYAERKNCNIEFGTGKDLFKNATQMSVYKRGLTIFMDNEGYPSLAQNTKELSGQAFLPENVTKKDAFMKNIRTQVKNIISNDKNWDNKFSQVQLGVIG